MGQGEGDQHPPYVGVQQIDGAGDAHQTARLALGRGDEILRRIGFHQHGPATGVISLPEFGDGEAAGGTLDKTHPESLLQHGDAAAEPRFGHAEGPAGLGKAPVIHHLDIEIEVVEILLHGVIVHKIGR